MRNSNESIGNRTSDLSSCSTVPQPNTSRRAPFFYVETEIIKISKHIVTKMEKTPMKIKQGCNIWILWRKDLSRHKYSRTSIIRTSIIRNVKYPKRQLSETSIIRNVKYPKRQISEPTFSSFYVQTTKNQRLLHAIQYCVISIKYCILYVLYCYVILTLS